MSINPAATVSTANGLAKRVNGKLHNLIPSKNLKLLNRLKFDQSDKLGSEFYEDICLTMEHGFTYGGSSGARRTLNSSEVAEYQPAYASPNSIHFRSEVTLELMSRASSKGEQAFEQYIAAMSMNSRKAFDKRLEIAMNRGGSSIGDASSATTTSTTSIIQITTKTWAPHVWIGMRNCPLEAYSTNTLLNINADLNVTKVDIKNKRITVVGNATDTALLQSTGTFSLYFKGAKNNGSAGTLDGTGMRNIANLSSGSYLNISADTYADVWSGTQVTWDQSTTDFTWTVLASGMEEAAGRGFMGDAVVQVPFNVWNTLNSSLDALRVMDSSYTPSKGEMGHKADSISYNTITGRVTVEPSGFQPYGEVVVYPDNPDSEDEQPLARRIGSSNVTFDYPGRGGEMFKLKEDTNTVEWRAFSDQVLWLPAPRNTILFTA
jgi:hypothetical protein